MCKQVGKAGSGAKDLLASFRGKNTADVRVRLFTAAKRWRGRIVVAESFEWFDHSSDNQRHYALEIQRSHFALCPRGFATSSYRLYEAMQLSTAPVVLADEWVAPEGPDWDSFTLRVAENDLESIPDLLDRNLHRAEEMGRKARVAWEEYFSPRNRLRTTLRSIECIRRNRCQDEASLQQTWKMAAFRASRGRRLLQAIARQTRKGAVV